MLNWIPYDLFKADETWRAKWLYLGNHLFKESFFDNSVNICQSHQSNSRHFKVVTALAGLEQACDQIPSIPPTAFIFHISRCGSTLLTQLLCINDENIVLSEPPLLDKILRLKYLDKIIPDDIRLGYLKNAVHLLGQKRFDYQRHYFIKWDCWHLFFIEEIRCIYPKTPFLFLTRNLPEIKLSHQKIPGMQVVQGVLEPEIFGYNALEIFELSPDQYLDNILLKMKNKAEAFSNKDSNSLLLPYENGSLNNFNAAIKFLQMEQPNQANSQKIMDRLKYHSKEPDQLFEQPIS